MSTTDHNLPIFGEEEQTTVGNYFVANYPPFSFWCEDENPAVDALLGRSPARGTPLGLYVHIPFCRKRCDFCYFRVYTDKNSSDIRRYLDAVIAEMADYAARPYIAGRDLRFVYFGGGTPSYLSVEQLEYLMDGLRRHLPWDAAEEVAFECEPGTLQEKKIHALRALGVTRLSIGVENFDPTILELNNRAHRAKEIDRAYGFARDAGFPQVNIDLIAGMVGETDANWSRCIDRSIELAPESITIYQMEVPYNTTIYRRMKDGQEQRAPVADWPTKRRWVTDAFARLEDAGYIVGSAYTAIKNRDVSFLYRDALWTGADMLGIGVSSFSHLDGVHFQNEHDFEPYLERIELGQRPVHRAKVVTEDEKLIREFVLQLKLGRLGTAYFRDKFGVNVLERFAKPLADLVESGTATIDGEHIELSRHGLLQVDRLLPAFFLPEHRDARYA